MPLVRFKRRLGKYERGYTAFWPLCTVKGIAKGAPGGKPDGENWLDFFEVLGDGLAGRRGAEKLGLLSGREE